MSDDKRDAGRGFKVTDRRSASEGSASETQSQVTSGEPPTAAEVQGGATDFPPIDFHTFILSLGSSALLHLGDLDPPDGGPVELDLPMAQHTIDVIAMLQEKTKGNLTAPEADLLESLLFDLRLRYVERSKAG